MKFSRRSTIKILGGTGLGATGLGMFGETVTADKLSEQYDEIS